MFKCFQSYRGWAILGVAILVALYLVIRHGAHLAAVLPFLILLACPLMHIFMHGSHSGHGKNPLPPPSPAKGGQDDTSKA
ncbi:MAG: DUF2933 domain-containing protein [Rhizobiales bacterium]|nr:DUF2933 domain-containing protein [Hyphomicrobiales bacterium]